jgi:hypothetical protein
VKGLTIRLAKLADEALHLDLRKPADREFLQLFSVIINQILIKLRALQESRLSPVAETETKEKILDDLRRMVQNYRIWRKKSLSLDAAEFRTAVRALLRECTDLFLRAA